MLSSTRMLGLGSVLVGLVIGAAPQTASADHRFDTDRGGSRAPSRDYGRSDNYRGSTGGSRSSFSLNLGFASGGSYYGDRSYTGFSYSRYDGGSPRGYGSAYGYTPAYTYCDPPVVYSPPVVYAPPPVVVYAPPPVVYAPAPVYYPAPRYYAPAPVYAYPSGGYYTQTRVYYRR